MKVKPPVETEETRELRTKIEGIETKVGNMYKCEISMGYASFRLELAQLESRLVDMVSRLGRLLHPDSPYDDRARFDNAQEGRMAKLRGHTFMIRDHECFMVNEDIYGYSIYFMSGEALGNGDTKAEAQRDAFLSIEV